MAKLGNLASRIMVAAVAVPILVFIIYQDSPVYTWLLVFTASLVALQEFFAMTLPDATDRRASMLCGGAAAAALYWLAPGALGGIAAAQAMAAGGPTATIFLAVVPVTLYYLFRFGDMATAGTRIAYSITGIVYVGLLLTFVALIKRDFGPSGGDILIFVLGVAWTGDTGAYFAGRFLGNSKLYPAVSPKKTWAGAIGGLVVSAGCAAGLKVGLPMLHTGPVLFDYLGWVDVFAMAVPGAILGQMGDLVESLIKRSTGVKDSGTLLPGHGGILDRVDAVLLLAPYVYLYLTIRPAL